jgi:hypothetical protein
VQKSVELTIAIVPVGRLFPQLGRNSVVVSLGSNLLRPVELSPVDSHAMQNDRELMRDRNLGLAEAGALGEPNVNSPSPELADLLGNAVQSAIPDIDLIAIVSRTRV